MLDFSQYEVISFDCYGTLIDWERGIFSALRPILAAHGKNIADAELLKLYSELEAEAEQGEFRPYREVLEAVVRGFGKRLGFEPTSAQARSLPESLADWRPFPDTVAALRSLKARYRLAIISNVDDDLFAATARRLEVRSSDYCSTSSRLQTFATDIQPGPGANWCTHYTLAARSPERLPRCSARAIHGNRHGLGETPFAASRRRSGQSSHGQTGPRSARPENSGKPESRELKTKNWFENSATKLGPH